MSGSQLFGVVSTATTLRAIAALLLTALILGQVFVLATRRFRGQFVPDYAGWSPPHILTDRRLRLTLGLLMTATWASVAIALIRLSLQPTMLPLLASSLGQLPIPPWLALILTARDSSYPLFPALFATHFWLDQSVSKRWSQPRDSPKSRMGQLVLPGIFALLAIVASWA